MREKILYQRCTRWIPALALRGGVDREGGLACISPGVGASRGGVLLGGTCCKMSVLPEVTGVKPLLASLIFGLLARMTRVDECMAGLDATPKYKWYNTQQNSEEQQHPWGFWFFILGHRGQWITPSTGIVHVKVHLFTINYQLIWI